MIEGPEVSRSDQEEAMPPNPFTAKISITKSSNPFTSKAKITKAAKAPKKKAKANHNPFASKPQENKQARIQAREQEIEHLRKLVIEAEREYEESLTEAIKKGVNKAQVKKMFDISDRKMATLMGATRRLREASNGDTPERTQQWAPSQKKKSSRSNSGGGAARKQANSSPSRTETTPLKISSAKVAAHKKKATTRQEPGSARRTRKHR